MLNVLTAFAFGLLLSSLVAVFTTRSARRRGFEEGRLQAIEGHRQEQEAAVHLLLSRLTSLIMRPCNEDAIPLRVQSIVGVIQSYQAAVADLDAPISAQLHHIQRALAVFARDPKGPVACNEVRQAFDDLRTVWPVKKLEIDAHVRGLLGQLTTIERHSSSDHHRVSRVTLDTLDLHLGSEPRVLSHGFESSASPDNR